MLLIRKKAFARAGLVGNPSDGYGGKTISLVVRDFCAEVSLYEWDQIEVVSSQNDQSCFDSLDELVRDVRLHGYYGGIRLVKATIKKFAEFCHHCGYPLHGRNFSARYQSNIPRQVGLAGSSAIIVATLRCLMEFFEVEIPERVQPSLVLSVETDELGIPGGLQDRVIQVYEGLVYMDFADDRCEEICGLRCGTYDPLDTGLLPPLYLAYSTDASEPTEVIHNNLRTRYQQGEPAVLAAMVELGQIALAAREALLERDARQLGKLVDANFEIRRSICRLPKEHVDMVERARAVGASAHFSGSGGAILGTYEDDAMFARLKKELGAIGCAVLKPTICPPAT
ncbi:MAG: mevalonate kinase family protein [Planctomycetota bacterium]